MYNSKYDIYEYNNTLYFPIYSFGYKTYYISMAGEIIKIIGGKEKPIKPFIHKDGFCQVSLSENGKVKKYSVHKLVADTFINNPKNYKYILHIDGDLKNNDLSNLRWIATRVNTNKKEPD